MSEGNVVVVKKPRGFATMTKERIQELARKGGVAAHARGGAHEFDSAEARAAGAKGGRATHAKRVAARAAQGQVTSNG